MRNLTLANQLTILRILIVPLFVILVVYGMLGAALLVVHGGRASPMRSTA